MTDLLGGALPFPVRGRVGRVVGNELEIRGIRLRVGDAVTVHTADGDRPAEIISLTATGLRALLFGETTGVGRGDPVSIRSAGFGAPVGPGLLGRVVGALGQPLDGGAPVDGTYRPLEATAPAPMERPRIDTPLPTGVRVVDTLCTIGKGQRIGIFAGSGVGKSTLLSMMARGTTADVNVLALIGERGREVREFIEDDLGPEGMARSVVVVATSDEPPLVRRRAALYATTIAEWFADQGGDVLLMMDSLTRLSMAQREIGLAAGEPPTSRGYTPSVFSLMPRLLERAGTRQRGTITGFYTVLTEGSNVDDDPIADAARSILDGHVHLDRDLLHKGRLPAIEPLSSMSRLAGRVQDPEQQRLARELRTLLAAAEDVRDLVEVGAYVSGTNPVADRALALMPALERFLVQDAHALDDYDTCWARLAQALTAAEVAA